jgi:S-DNA-T family DNA segregation ATPase FtsK/SpoIIIE
MQAFEDMKIAPIRIKMIRESGEDTRTAVVVLPPGSNISPQAIIGKRKELMNNLGCRHIEIVPTGPKNEIQVTWFDGDDESLADTILWPGPSITSFEEPIPLGLFENLEVVEQCFLWLHALIAGATDNGKSGVVNVILCTTLPCTDVVRIGIDCKDGAPELGPYRKVMFHLATNPEEGMRTLNGVRAIIKARGEFLGTESEPSDDNEDGVPVRKWDTKYGPYILVPLDELAELTREYGEEAGKQLESIRQLGRYVGVHSLDATQYPSKGVFGGKTDPRQQYQVRIGMSCPEAASINVIFGTGAQSAGWRLEQLKYKGSFMIKSRSHQYPRNARAYYITDETIAAMVKEWTGKVPDLDDMSAEAFHAAHAMPLKPKGGPNRPGGRRGVEDEDQEQPYVSSDHQVRLHVVPNVRYPSKDPNRRGEPVEAHLSELWKAFSSRPSSSVDELVDLKLPRLTSRDPVRKWLRQWVTAGYAWKSADGRYYPEPDLYRKEA